MIKLFIYGSIIYFIFSLIKKKNLFTKASSSKSVKNNPYKNLNIKDADFEDISDPEDRKN